MAQIEEMRGMRGGRTMKRRLFILAAVFFVAACAGASLAMGEMAATNTTLMPARSAADAVKRLCNIAVTDVDLESLIIAICNNTGMVVSPGCPLFSISGAPIQEAFEYTDNQGRQVRSEDYVESKASTHLDYSTHGDRTISSVLDDLLNNRGYCWHTLGRRLFIKPKQMAHGVSGGQGYIRNVTTGEVVVLRYSSFRAEEEAAREQAAGMALQAENEASRAKIETENAAKEAAKEEEMFQAQLAFYRTPTIVNTYTTFKPTINLRNNVLIQP
jgi:hypothetical protein